MSYKKKNLTREELSAIRSAASRKRKHYRGGKPKAESSNSKKHVVNIGEWEWSVFKRLARDRKVTVRELMRRIAVALAQRNGIPVNINSIEKK